MGPRESRHTASLLSTNHFCLRMCLVAHFPVAISEGSHPFPSRTRKLSPPEPMVLRGKPRGRVGRCRIFFSRPWRPSLGPRGVFFCPGHSVHAAPCVILFLAAGFRDCLS